MRYPTILFLFVLSNILPGQTNVSLRSITTYSGQHLSNIWGYASGGQEYALVGAQFGMIIMNVTDPDNPVQISQISGPSSDWREIKTYSHYAYVVSEGGSGVQIVDLSTLPNPPVTYHSYFGNGAGSGLTKAHALHIDETKGYLYLYGTNLFGGKAYVCNLNVDPYNPSFVNYVNFGGSGNSGYVHDGYVDNDLLYAANIYAGYFAVYNMANKSSPVLLATQPTPGLFTHNTWRSGNSLFTTDEVSSSFLSSYDISNPGNITLLDKIQSNPGSGSIVHNTYIVNDYAITSWYRDGFTIVDVARPANMVQVGNYDTYVLSGNGFDGSWGVYPYLPSGNILSSVIKAQGTQNGQMYICTPNYVRGCYLEGKVTAAATGNPLNGALVKILTTSIQETTGANGLYKMGLLQGGNYTIEVSKSGYQTFYTSANLSNGVLTTLDVALQLFSLPVELTRFSVETANRDALLQWKTASETNNTGFEIQQSSDGAHWTQVGFVAAKGPSEYDFRVENLSPGRWYFRLRQLDRDGAETYSDAQSVVIQGNGITVHLYPNTVSDQCRLHLTSEHATSVQVEIFDAKLQTTGLKWIVDIDDQAELPVSMGGLAAGIYLIVARTEKEKVSMVFVKE